MRLWLWLATSIISAPLWADDGTYAESAATIETDSAIAQKDSLGLGVVYAQNIYAGIDNKLQPFPLVNLFYNNFFLQSTTAGYTFYRDPELSFAAVMQPQFGGYDASDSDALAGMRDTSYLLNTGAQLGYRLEPLSFSLSALHDITGRSAGNSANIKLAASVPLEDKRLVLIPSISALWEDCHITNYYYGVSAGEATLTRPAYTPSSALNINYALTLKYHLSEHWGSTVGYLLTAYGDEIAESPIVSRKYASSGLAGISYIF